MTFSILAYDPITESYGGASATGNICVGGWVLRGNPLSGVSASQGSEPSTLWGEDILKYTGDGLDAETAIYKTIIKDKGKERRQLSVIDKKGNSSVFSGKENSSIIDEIVSKNLVLSENATIIFGTDTFLAGYARFANRFDFRRVWLIVSGG